VDGVRAFCPASQADLQRVADLTSYVGRVLEFLVTEVDEGKRRVIVSRRALLARQQSEQAREKLAQITPGQELEGTVRRLEPFGAFVDLGGIEGLVHVSELSHARVAHARDVVTVGDRVRVRVLRVDADERRPRVALSIRALAPDPWAENAARFAVGMRVPGVVVRLTDFGAFVNLAPGIDGLIHVSQASDQRVQHVREVLSPGQSVEAVVLGVDPERKRISLSIREAREHPIEGSRMVRDIPPAGDAPPRERGRERRRDRGPAGDRERAGERGGGRPRGGDRESGRDRGRGREREREHERPREREAAESAAPRRAEPEALTTMQLAFRKAREERQRRESKE
jgi:small subunit ribosomal protein S1